MQEDREAGLERPGALEQVEGDDQVHALALAVQDDQRALHPVEQHLAVLRGADKLDRLGHVDLLHRQVLQQRVVALPVEHLDVAEQLVPAGVVDIGLDLQALGHRAEVDEAAGGRQLVRRVAVENDDVEVGRRLFLVLLRRHRRRVLQVQAGHAFFEVIVPAVGHQQHRQGLGRRHDDLGDVVGGEHVVVPVGVLDLDHRRRGQLHREIDAGRGAPALAALPGGALLLVPALGQQEQPGALAAGVGIHLLPIDGKVDERLQRLGAVVGEAGEHLHFGRPLVVSFRAERDDADVAGVVGADPLEDHLALHRQVGLVEDPAVGVDVDVGRVDVGAVGLGDEVELRVGELVRHLQ